MTENWRERGVSFVPSGAALLWWQQQGLPDTVPPAAPEIGGGNYLWLLFQMILYLGIICLVVYLLLKWLLPRLYRWRLPHKGPMTLIDQIHMGGGKSVCIVKIVGEYYLLGVSDGGIHLITKLEAGRIEEYYPTGAEKGSAPWPLGGKKR